jgi:chemotaxis protein histidine kinase CheA
MDLGGAVTVESEPGKGTRILVEIPSVNVERK